MITSRQCRAARALLDWSQQDLAERARVGIVTIRQLEAGIHEPRRSTLDVVRRALEAGGVQFIEENGGGAGVARGGGHVAEAKRFGPRGQWVVQSIRLNRVTPESARPTCGALRRLIGRRFVRGCCWPPAPMSLIAVNLLLCSIPGDDAP